MSEQSVSGGVPAQWNSVTAIEPFQHNLTILPERLDGESGIYADDAIDIVKEMRASNLDVAYLHDAEHRSYRNLKGDVPVDLLIGVVGSLVANVIWAGFLAALRNVLGQTHPIRCEIIRRRRKPDGGVDSEIFRYAGTVDGLAETLPYIDPPE